ncbi:hypothetical protein DFQ04_3069 [Algoriphagus boseongensis]|uniref:Uncharacterized protein n=1 Tax=Algoriphagus boseongensis TaxID=1442587 RepID=A0A4R6T3A9_9BACT|nr:hypothetical protein [Algoriphagus boseongensis]TDQ15183.1 hypothetical protein DFQ04_3069 [Algoriphagus boseongensis]
MNNSLVQQTLVDIEQNLKNLQSAREQVNSVSLSSQKLTETISSLVKNFKTLEADFLKDSKEFSDKIEKEFVRFQTNMETGAKNAINQSSKIHQKHGVEIDKTIDKLSELQKAVLALKNDLSGFDLASQFNPIIEALHLMEGRIDAFKIEMNSLTSRLNRLADNMLKDQQEWATKLDQKYDSIKSAIQYTQIFIAVATTVLASLILIF